MKNTKIIKGWINANLSWYSPTDLSKKFSKSRQYWCKLIKQGKLKAYKTKAAPIVTTEDLQDYLSKNPL